ncbi:hypothetical protein K470DRAFT_192949, partial [Piedraia hortae CBS 480.64]
HPSPSCLACGRIFPATHILDLHIREHHDPFVSLQRARGEKVYRCFVEGCEKVCRDGRRRRLHCIDKHGYPWGWGWGVVDRGL